MSSKPQAEIEQDLHLALVELGLHESEMGLYLTSLKLGPVGIAKIAETIGIPRPNIYKAIAGLEERGLARFSDRKKYTRTFVVEPPTVVLEQLRKKRAAMADLARNLVSAMPDLLARYHQGETLTKLRVLQGKEQFLAAFFSILDEEGEETQFFGSAKDFLKFISWDEEYRWMARREERGIFVRSLLLPSDEAELLHKTDKEHLREIRIIKGLPPFVTAFQLYANKVLIWQPEGSLALQIEDEFIVAMLRSIFERLWDTSAPQKANQSK